MMEGTSTLKVAEPGTARATLASLPQEVLEMIVNRLHGNDKGHLALCCKATLPTLCMGHVRVHTDHDLNERQLLQATRCLTKQPGGVLHLEVIWWGVDLNREDWVGTRHLIDLSLLPNLHKLTLHGVYVSLPALQPVATRLHELSVYGSRLQGSADSFLTKGWTALTSLSLHNTRMDNASLPKTLELPALEDVHFCNFTGHQGGELQLDQLTGSCPQVSRLRFRLGESLAQATEASRQGCRLLGLSRLADLHVMSCPGLQANVELDLPTSLTQLKFGSYQGGGGSSVNFLWALREAVKCVGRGARLHKLMCNCAEYLQPVQWGVSLDEQHRRLGCQLGSLRELEVLCDHEQLLSAVGAVASAAPCLVRLEIMIPSLHSLSSVEVPPICSASLESIRVSWSCFCETHMLGVLKPSPRQVLLTFLPGCTRLQEVVVDFPGPPCEGAAVKLRCHCCSRRCIVPQEVNAGAGSEVIVNFVRVPSARVQDYTVLSACHAAGPEQAPLWGHNVMPGIL